MLMYKLEKQKKMQADKFCNFTHGIYTEIKYLLYAMFVYLDIDMNVFKILIWLMFIDTITGIIKALRIDYKRFTFKKLKWGLVSKFVILIIPLVASLLYKGVGEDIGIEVVLIIKLLIVSEFLSIITNIYIIKTNKVVKDIDIFTLIFKLLRKAILGFLFKFIKIDEDGDEEVKDDIT